MPKRKGDSYLGGSTVLRAGDRSWFSKNSTKVPVHPEDRAYAPPKLTAAERKEIEILREKLANPEPTLIKREDMELSALKKKKRITSRKLKKRRKSRRT